MKLSENARLFAAFQSKKSHYQVRTAHLNKDGKPIFINDLIESASPYLLQHAHNPVNWQPWSDAAFAQAERENKAIFLSIGYATCHWCHVMEHESFEDVEVADFLNTHFVCIKVDREQHPVVDDFYMTALQLIQGQGGWPLSAFLMPDGKPFMAGTYFPQVRFMSLLQQIRGLWQGEQDKLQEQAKRIHTTVSRYLSGDQNKELINWSAASDQLSDELMAMADSQQGGFGTAPKFPQEAWLQFLLYRYLDQQDKTVAEHLCLSLKQMQKAGIHDQLAGGFHRYAVDEAWLVPHFEKLLYNQAQLLLLYAQSAVIFDEPSFAGTAKATAAFVFDEMQAVDGLFYAGIDADSEDASGQSVEGAYYVWSSDELDSLLNAEQMAWLARYFDVRPGGNFEGQHILHQRQSIEGDANWPVIQKRLKQARRNKIRPITDHKIILSWNAMMIEALAWSGQLLADETMKQQALRAMEQLKATHYQGGEWWRISVDGQQQNIPAVLSDLANLAAALFAIDQTGLKNTAGDLLEVLETIKTQFWKLGHMLQAATSDQIPAVVNAKDGATVSAVAKLVSVLSGVASEDMRNWRSEILKGLGGAINRQNTAHAGLFTAQLQSNNHIMGQRQVTRSGLTLSWQRVSKDWKLVLEDSPHWHRQKTEILLDSGEVMFVPEQQGQVTLPSSVKHITVQWMPCDDEQCWPQQSCHIALL